VVLGGTSIFGGIGSVHGTLLGVAAIAVLNNGLVHIRQPRELAGILTGALLLLALSASVIAKRWPRAVHLAKLRSSTLPPHENILHSPGHRRQLLCRVQQGSCRNLSFQSEQKLTIALLPKSKGNAYLSRVNKAPMRRRRNSAST
jgi:rhamnose transport system permease protein